MAYKISYGDSTYVRQADDSVLDTLLAQGIDIPHSCRSGVCQSCLMQALEGVPSEAAQAGLKSTYRAKAYFLACCWYPEEDVVVKLPNTADSAVAATISEIEPLNHNVVRLRLIADKPFDAIAGQHLTLITPHNVARSYSIANVPDEEAYIELHVRVIANGKLSSWLLHEAKTGMAVYLRGPAGECFYVAEDEKNFPIILAGTGTGLAPLLGIARDALRQGHRGDIHLFHGALKPEDLYLVEYLQALSDRYAHFNYTPCVLHGLDGKFYVRGDIQELVVADIADKKNTRIYLCGAPELVNSLKKKVFLAGASLAHIYHDAFLPSK